MKNIRHKIGDEVIALNTPPDKRSQQREKGKKYIIQAVSYCGYCGIQLINIGQKIQDDTEIVKCNCDWLQLNQGLKWTAASEFISVNNIEEFKEELIEQEDYDTLILLRDM